MRVVGMSHGKQRHRRRSGKRLNKESVLKRSATYVISYAPANAAATESHDGRIPMARLGNLRWMPSYDTDDHRPGL